MTLRWLLYTSLCLLSSYCTVEHASAAATGACTLCRDGSTLDPLYLPKPIGIKEPIEIGTCAEFESLIVFFTAEDPLCSDAQLLGTYCGCPVADNACRVCPGNLTLANPTLQLSIEGLLEGVNTTCDMFDSGLSMVGKDDEQCMHFPLDEIQELCGCEEKHAIDEDHLQPKEKCSLCEEGQYLTNPKAKVITAVLVDARCASIEVHLSTILKEDPQCLVTDEMAVTCKCGDIAEDEISSDRCTLCRDGNTVGYPDKDLAGTVDPLFEFMGEESIPESYSCAMLDIIMSLEHKDSDLCQASHGLEKICGCPSRMNACHICGGEDSGMTKPLAKIKLAMAFGGESFAPPDTIVSGEDKNTWVDFLDRQPLACELIDSALAAWVDENEDGGECYNLQFEQSQFCGCENASHRALYLLWCQRVMAMLSLLVSVFEF